MMTRYRPEDIAATAPSDADWDLMFAAVSERLRLHASGPRCGDAALVLDCVHALGLLHSLREAQRAKARTPAANAQQR